MTSKALAARLAPLVMIALASCVAPSGPPPIPTLQSERVPSPPPSTVTLIWQPGHYDWDAGTYRWVRGLWVPREGHGRLWQDGFWRRSASGWEWTAAHWM